MRQSMGKAYGALLTAFCACAASAADFTVAAGSPRTMTAAESSIAYGAVTVDDDLTLNGSAIGLTNLSSIVIGENATHPVTIVVTNGAKWIVKPDQTMKFTGKGGTLVVSAPSLQTFGWGTKVDTPFGSRYVLSFATAGYYTYLQLSANAEAAGGEMDVVRLLPNGTTSFRQFKNLNASVDARILFEGGINWVQNPSGGLFAAENGGKIILQSVNGSPIHFRGAAAGTGRSLFTGDGTLETRGTGDVIFHLNDNPPSTFNLTRSAEGTILWNHSGRTLFRGASVWKVGTDNILPYGTQTGPIVFANTDYLDPRYATTLDLNGKTVSVNGLLVEGTSQYSGLHAVTNSAVEVATLRLFVPTNVALSAILKAKFAANATNIKIQKIGCGTLLIDRQVPGDLDIAECGYRLAIDNPAPHGTFTVADGAGQCLGDNNIPANTDGQRAVYTHRPFAGADDLLKIGSNTVQCINGAALSATRLHVSTGTFSVVSGTCRTETFWRVTLKGTRSDATRLLLSAFNLFAADGSIVTLGITNFTAGTAPSALPPNSCCPPDSGEIRQYSDNPYDEIAGLFRNASYVVEWKQVPVVGNEATWRKFWFRLPDGAKPVFGYMLKIFYWATPTIAIPLAWEVECSPTGLDGSWTKVDDQTTTSEEQYPSYSATYLNNLRPLGPGGVYNWGVPYVVTGGMVPDTAVFNSTATVQVDAGAKLDLSAVADANLSFAALAVDLAKGGGTITKFRPAANGTLELTGASGRLPTHLAVPVAISEMVDGGNFGTWRVMVDGNPSPATKLAWIDGVLTANTDSGTVIVIR